MNFKTLMLMGSLTLLLPGCASIGKSSSESMNRYASAQELIDQKNLNESSGGAKEYVYVWGAKHADAEPQSLYPRKYLSNYCHSQNGSFSLLHKSTLSLVKDAKSRNTLAAHSNIKQGIGAYQCAQKNGQRWIVSIEPVSESRSSQFTDARAVRLKTEIMSADEARRFYKNSSASGNASKKAAAAPAAKNTAAPKPAVKNLDVKEAEDKKETAEAAKPSSAAVTPQQQQMKYYVAARRDLAKGQTQVSGCQNAQKAYNYGKLHGANASNVYADSGVLLARCLTSVPAYNRQVLNARAKAVGILQNLSKNYNHAGAKHMLNQMK